MAMTTTRTSVHFKDCKTLEELEAKYLAIWKERGDDTEYIEEITKEYDKFFIVLRDAHNKKVGEHQRILADPTLLRTMVAKTLAIKDEAKGLDFKEDCTLERDRNYLWVYPKEGKPKSITKKYTEVLSWRTGLGYQWSSRLGAWYFDATGRPWKPYKNRRGHMTTEERRNYHGCEFLNSVDDLTV